MQTSTLNPFNTRAFVAAMAVFTGIGLPISGIANHVVGFELLTVERHAWMAAHNMMALLFTVFVTWHVVLNRRALAHHLQKARLPRLSREAVLAGVIVAALMALAIGHAFATGARQ